MKIPEQIEVRQRRLSEIQSRLSMIRTDSMDSEEHFQSRVKDSARKIAEWEEEIVKFQLRIQREQKYQTQILAHRADPDGVAAELREEQTKIGREIAAFKLILLQQQVDSIRKEN